MATSLAEEVGLRLPFFEEFFAATVAAVAESTAFAADDATWVDELRALSAHVEGDTIRARLGDRTVEGRFAGFDAHGFLVLEHAGGREVVRSGEVFAW